MNGNYKLIDLKNIEIKSGSTGATIDGVYDAIDKATMPVKVINVNKNGTKLVTNFGQGVRKSGSNYYVDLGDGTELKVTDADKVTYTNKSGGDSVEIGYIGIEFVDGVATLDNAHKKDLNSLNITVKESNATVATYTSGTVNVGGHVTVPAKNDSNVLTALYEVTYAGVTATITKITLS